jgi:protein O-mannosyl-transferase
MLLLDWWPLKRFTIYDLRFTILSLVREKIPFFVLSAISCVVTFMVQQKSGAVANLAGAPLTGRIANAFVAYAGYLGKTLWPASLANLYPYPAHWEFSMVIYSVALVAGLSAIAILFARRFPFVFTGWFWFAGTLIPVIGLVQVGIQSMADRYTYVPLIGLFIIFVWGLAEAGISRQVPKALFAVMAAMVLVVGAWRTGNQLSYWQDNETLFFHTLAVTENNYLAYNNLGTWLSKKGQITEALDYFRKSLQINPDSADVLYNLGNAFAKLHNWDGAITNYQHALQIKPDQPDVLDNLGFALAAKKRFAEAVVCFKAALKLDPDNSAARGRSPARSSGPDPAGAAADGPRARAGGAEGARPHRARPDAGVERRLGPGDGRPQRPLVASPRAGGHGPS